MIRDKLIAVGEWGSAVGEAAYWLVPAPLRSRRGSVPALRVFEQIDRFAIGILPLLVLVLACVGMILALQLAAILELLGAVEFLPDIVGVAMVREMAPLLVGVVLSGALGASIASEIGALKITGELGAHESPALSAAALLLAPRLIAIAIAAPLVTAFGFAVGIAGGLAISEGVLGMEIGQCLTRTADALGLEDLILGLAKGEVFGIAVVSIAWHAGSRADGGPGGVGRAATAAVVRSIVAVIAADLLLTMLFYRMGWR